MADEIQSAPATDAAMDDSAPSATTGQSDVASTVRDALHGKITEQKVTEPIRDAVTKALKAETDKAAEQAKAVKADADGRVRGPDGKFVAKDGTAQPAQPAPPEPPEQKPADAKPSVGDQAPTAWRKEIAAKHWATLDPEVKAEIAKRERDTAKIWEAHQKIKHVEPLVGFANELGPRLGITGPVLMQQWAQFQAAIMDPAKKEEAFKWLEKQYGRQAPAPTAPAADPAQAAATEWKDPQVAALEKQLAELSEWKRGRETQLQQAERMALESIRTEKQTVFERFAAEKGQDGQPLRPLLDDAVMTAMVPFITHLKSTNPQISDQDALTQAYETVVWGNPTTRAQLVDQQRQADEAKRQAEHKARAQAASRAAVSPATASPQGPAASAPVKGSVEATVRHAFQQVSAA